MAARGYAQVSTQPENGPIFPGAKAAWTGKLQFITEKPEKIPIYRILNRTGSDIVNAEENLEWVIITS